MMKTLLSLLLLSMPIFCAHANSGIERIVVWSCADSYGGGDGTHYANLYVDAVSSNPSSDESWSLRYTVRIGKIGSNGQSIREESHPSFSPMLSFRTPSDAREWLQTHELKIPIAGGFAVLTPTTDSLRVTDPVAADPSEYQCMRN
ncbi:MAG: hypothetical protein H7301_04210 [Cryobacterium sp.]|nr:hypothetical protein [Oligoflexia bacterium]